MCRLDWRTHMDLTRYIRDIPDFPKPGIIFKDITPILKDPAAFTYVISELAGLIKDLKPDAVAAVESRGFIFAAPLALRTGVPFIPLRKPGKLPAETISMEYSLEYGSSTIEVHRDALSKGSRVVVLDDLLATGGTAGAACKLMELMGAEVVRVLFVIELAFLNGREVLKGYDVMSLVSYS